MLNEIELRHLRYFAAVAEDLSFTRAAERLRIAQPALSQQIRQLERRIEATLFVRSPRVALTPAGAAYLIAALQVIAQVRHAGEVAKRVAGGARAVLQIGIASSAALTDVPHIVRRFVRQQSGIDIRIREMHSRDQMDALQRGALDIGFLREPLTDSRFVSHELLREPFVLLLPSRHRLATRRAVRLSDCAAEPFVLFPRASAPTLHDQIQHMCNEAGFAADIDVEAGEWHTIAALVAAGFGISVAPATVAAIQIRGMTVRHLSTQSARAVLFLCYARDTPSPSVLAFARFALSRMHAIKRKRF